jgi:hypothetical protein
VLERKTKNPKKRRREIHDFQSIFLPLEGNPWLPYLKKMFVITRERLRV